MFSEQYKKDNEKISLSDDFLEQLKFKMRQEQLKETNISESKNILNNECIGSFAEKRAHDSWKRSLPIVLTACAAIATVAIVPNLFPEKKSNRENESSVYDSVTSFIEEAPIIKENESEKSDNTTSEIVNEEKMESADTIDDYTAGSATTEQPSEDISKDFKTDDQMVGKLTLSNDASEEDAVAIPSDLSFDEATIDFTQPKTFLPSDPAILSAEVKKFLNYSKGTDMVTLDYAANQRLILHDYYGLIVYDYENEEILRVVDLPSRIGKYTTQGDTTLNVTVYQNGNYLLLNKEALASTDHDCYLYDIQTDTMITLKMSELSRINLPEPEENLIYDVESMDELLPIGYRSDATAVMDNNQFGFLFYGSSDDSTIASLSFCKSSYAASGKLIKVSISHLFEKYGATSIEMEGPEYDQLNKKIHQLNSSKK